MSVMKTVNVLQISTFKKFVVLWEKLLREIPSETNRISTKWFLSTKKNAEGTKKWKASLFARDFEDSEKKNISRDSPVSSNSTLRIVLQILAEKQWILQSYDFLSASFQGKLLDRLVFIPPPSELDIPNGLVWITKKPICSLLLAQKSWYGALL